MEKYFNAKKVILLIKEGIEKKYSGRLNLTMQTQHMLQFAVKDLLITYDEINAFIQGEIDPQIKQLDASAFESEFVLSFFYPVINNHPTMVFICDNVLEIKAPPFTVQ